MTLVPTEPTVFNKKGKPIPARRAGYYHIAPNKIYPSVTTILKVLNKPLLTQWQTRRAVVAALDDPSLEVSEAIAIMEKEGRDAAARGSEIHRLISTGEPFPDEYAGYAAAYRSFRESIFYSVLHQEFTVYSDSYGYAGTLDLLANIGDSGIYVIDFKTGKAVYRDFALQLSAYRQAVEEMGMVDRVDGIAIVRLGMDGSFDFRKMEDDFDAFLAALQLWQWDNRITPIPKRKLAEEKNCDTISKNKAWVPRILDVWDNKERNQWLTVDDLYKKWQRVVARHGFEFPYKDRNSLSGALSWSRNRLPKQYQVEWKSVYKPETHRHITMYRFPSNGAKQMSWSDSGLRKVYYTR